MVQVFSFLQRMGESMTTAVVLPVLVWTAFSWLILAFLKREHTLKPHLHLQYAVRVGLLLALPLSFALAQVLGWQMSWHHWLFGDPKPVQSIILDASSLQLMPVDPSLSHFVQPPWSQIIGSACVKWQTWAGLAIVGMLIFSFIQAVQLLRSWVWLRKLRRALDWETHDVFESQLNALFEQLPRRRNVQIASFKSLFPPFTFGWLRPTIALPDHLLDEPEKVRLILAHELVHIRRHDALWQGCAQWILVAFAVHPLVRALVKEMEYYREASCDAIVLKQDEIDRKQYALLLFELLGSPSMPPRFAFATAMASHPSHLKQRINAMNIPFQRPKGHQLGLLGACFLALVLITAVFANQASKPKGLPITQINTQQIPTPKELYPILRLGDLMPQEAKAKDALEKVYLQNIKTVEGILAHPQGLSTSLIREYQAVHDKLQMELTLVRTDFVKVSNLYKKASADTTYYGTYQGKKVIGVMIFVDDAEKNRVRLTLENGSKVRLSIIEAERLGIKLPPPPPPAPPPPPPPPPAPPRSAAPRQATWDQVPKDQIESMDVQTRNGKKFTIVTLKDGRQLRLDTPPPPPPPPPPPLTLNLSNPTSPNNGTPNADVYKDFVFQFAETAPRFPGDSDALHQYLQDNVRYPAEAKAAGIQGPVYVQFIVGEEGNIFEAKITRGIGGGCDEEALRLVNAMPRWTPGRQNGIPVKVKHTIQVRFKL